jgi:hypothetical protein
MLVLILAALVRAQDRYLASRIPHVLEPHVLAAFDGTRCVGFLPYLVQVIGAEEGRPAVMHNNQPLLEGYVEAFEIDQRRRGRGIGNRASAARGTALPGRRLPPDALPQSGDKHRELRPEDCRRVRSAP